jgi:hypothetical protein
VALAWAIDRAMPTGEPITLDRLARRYRADQIHLQRLVSASRKPLDVRGLDGWTYARRQS